MTNDEYHKIDYRIMEQAFSIHNMFGRFQEESTYQNELAHQIRKLGFRVDTEVPLDIEYGSFKKNCFIDILINETIIYELKVIDTLSAKSWSQVLNYQLISEIPFGKLINFGANSVEHEFSTTSLTRKDRQNFHIDDSNFSINSEQSSIFRDYFIALLSEWGTHLELSLYCEAMTYLMGGDENVLKLVRITSDTRTIGSKQIRQVSDREAFKITGLSNPSTITTHLKRFLETAELDVIQWVNINKHSIEFRTLRKE